MTVYTAVYECADDGGLMCRGGGDDGVHCSV